jgi:hypothetical protein
MKLIVRSLLAAITISLASYAYAQSPQPQSVMPPAPEAQPGPAPSTDQPAPAEASSATVGNTRLAALVPTGLSPAEACRGFKDLSDCSAALHVSQNLNIPFADLKDRVTAGQSLGTAIHALKPKADARRELKRAEEQAREDLRSQG